jgi:hypothetical protein
MHEGRAKHGQRRSMNRGRLRVPWFPPGPVVALPSLVGVVPQRTAVGGRGGGEGRTVRTPGTPTIDAPQVDRLDVVVLIGFAGDNYPRLELTADMSRMTCAFHD